MRIMGNLRALRLTARVVLVAATVVLCGISAQTASASHRNRWRSTRAGRLAR